MVMMTTTTMMMMMRMMMLLMMMTTTRKMMMTTMMMSMTVVCTTRSPSHRPNGATKAPKRPKETHRGCDHTIRTLYVHLCATPPRP